MTRLTPITSTFVAKDGLEIFAYRWQPENADTVRGVLQLVHGSLEHVFRYQHFVEKLVGAGYAVYANDIRGHGQTATRSGLFSYFSDQRHGWELAVDDLGVVTEDLKKQWPELPVFIFGHSMGSILVRDYVSQRGEEFRGALITGTGRAKSFLLYPGLLLAKLFALFGKKRPSPILHFLIYGALNRAVENPTTDYDFLSRDAAEVQKYIDDRLSGHTATVDYAHEMARGVIRAHASSTFTGTPRDLSLFFFSGLADPVGGPQAKYVREAEAAYRQAGVRDVTTKLYPGARHELLNETNKEEVMADVIQWLDARTDGGP